MAGPAPAADGGAVGRRRGAPGGGGHRGAMPSTERSGARSWGTSLVGMPAYDARRVPRFPRPLGPASPAHRGAHHAGRDRTGVRLGGARHPGDAPPGAVHVHRPRGAVRADSTGVRVQVPFGARSLPGLVVALLDQSDHADARPISAVLDEEPLLSEAMVGLAEWIAERYCAPLPEVIKAMVPRGRAPPGPRPAGGAGRAPPPPPSRAARAEGTSAPAARADRGAATGRRPAPRGDRRRRHRARPAPRGDRERQDRDLPGSHRRRPGPRPPGICLVPEIALTPQMIRRFAARFPGRLAVSRSGLADAERAVDGAGPGSARSTWWSGRGAPSSPRCRGSGWW